MTVAKKEDVANFESLYAELNVICLDNENTPKDQPVQWEALADFTENLEDAVKDYMSSIAFSIALD